PPYPHQGRGRTPPFGPPLTAGPDDLFDLTNDAIRQQFVWAQEARQRLANHIYRPLPAGTGVGPRRPQHNPQEPGPAHLRTPRWLAQLAANIVDYIDEDEISTPFNFYTVEDSPDAPPNPDRFSQPDNSFDRNVPLQAGEIQWPLYWVFGTELPRIVVNE